MSGDLKEGRGQNLWISGGRKLQAEETARAKALGWELVTRASGRARNPTMLAQSKYSGQKMRSRGREG